MDGLRGIAALMVVFYHCGVGLQASPFFVPGYTGVHLFFVLSGYLIARPFLACLVADRPLPSWRRYAVRRLVRIYPTYLVALAGFIAMRVAGHLHAPARGDVIRHVFLIFNWGRPAEFFTINIVMWTLAIEAQFYVLLPLAVFSARRMSRSPRVAPAVIALFALVGVCSRGLEYTLTTGEAVRFRLPFSFLDLFAAGMFVAYLELTRGEALRRHLLGRTAILFTAIASFLVVNYWLATAGTGDWLTPASLAQVTVYPLVVCAAFAAILLVVRTRLRARLAVLTARPLTFVGEISYSVYLYHVGVGFALLSLLPHGAGAWLGARPPVYALAQLGPVLFISYLAYRAVERPSLLWLERFSARTPRPLAVR